LIKQMNIEHHNLLDVDDSAARSDWADMSGRDHFVQFYRDEKTIIAAVAAYFAHGLRFGERCVMVATGDHTRAVEGEIRQLAPYFDAAVRDGKFIALDANDVLGKFMVGDMPDAERFEQVVGALIRKAAAGGSRVRAFGEMVAVLTDQGNAPAAVELEGLWNKLAEREHFRLFCAYPHQSLSRADTVSHADSICSSHSHVLGLDAALAF
jgi:MEDS: MEthanogen/methylotroph, DcmR Sensory domain